MYNKQLLAVSWQFSAKNKYHKSKGKLGDYSETIKTVST
jgi:hypothetical protein